MGTHSSPESQVELTDAAFKMNNESDSNKPDSNFSLESIRSLEPKWYHHVGVLLLGAYILTKDKQSFKLIETAYWLRDNHRKKSLLGIGTLFAGPKLYDYGINEKWF